MIFLCRVSSNTACRREFTSVAEFASDLPVAPLALLANKFPIKEDEPLSLSLGPRGICKSPSYFEKCNEIKNKLCIIPKSSKRKSFSRSNKPAIPV